MSLGTPCDRGCRATPKGGIDVEPPAGRLCTAAGALQAKSIGLEAPQHLVTEEATQDTAAEGADSLQACRRAT